jgi:hypothetical protein
MDIKEQKGMGIIASRRCPHCGHHEVGYVDDKGMFHPLKPGMKIQIMELDIHRSEVLKHKSVELTSTYEKVWIPPPVLGHKILRIRYGIWIREDQDFEKMDSRLYRMGYLNKIRLLLEKGTSNPLPVILDRFFTAPHLASGTPEQITLSLWKELDEIRSPSLVVERWLESGDDKVVNEMIAPFTKRDLVSVPPDEKVILEELSSITLEDFFASLEQ